MERRFPMADNLAYQYDYEEEYHSEMLDGNIVLMAPRPATNHLRVLGNIFAAFSAYLRGKRCEAFPDGADVFLTEKDRVVPDVMIVCDKNKIQPDGIHGAPDLIVEVLSRRTEKRDRGYKRDLYERCGVREYWIVNTEMRSVEVYLLKNGKLILDDVYQIFPEYEKLQPEEKETYKDAVPVSLYDNFSVSLDDIFYNVF